MVPAKYTVFRQISLSDLFRVSRELDGGGRPHPLLQCLPPPVQERLCQVSVLVRLVYQQNHLKQCCYRDGNCLEVSSTADCKDT